MSSDQSSKTTVGGSAAAPSQMAAREGALTSAMTRAVMREASVSVRAMDDGGEARDLALTGSEYSAKKDSQLKAMAAGLLDEMRNNPEVQAKSGTDWAQKTLAQHGLIKELNKLIEGTPVVEERQYQSNIQHLIAFKPITEMSPLQVKFLQQNLEGLGLYSGKIDGDFSNPQMIASLDNLVKSQDVLQKAMDRNGGRATLDFVWALRNPDPKLSAPSGEAKIMALFKENAVTATSEPAPTVAALRFPDPRLEPTPA